MTFDFNSISEVRLSSGKHISPEEGMCFMEMAAWFAGEEHSDRPRCVSPSLASLGIIINDTMPYDLRDKVLKPMIPHVVGTVDEAAERVRVEYICLRAFNYSAGILFPDFVRHHGPRRSFRDAEEMFRHAYSRSCIYEHQSYDYDYSSMKVLKSELMNYRHLREIFARLSLMFEKVRPVSFEPPVCEKVFSYPNEYNAEAAGGVFALMAEILPDLSAAVDTLREAIKLGRHDGFDTVVNLEEKHEELRKLIEA